MLKIRRPLGRLIFNMGIAIPGKTVFLIETAPCSTFVISVLCTILYIITGLHLFPMLFVWCDYLILTWCLSEYSSYAYIEQALNSQEASHTLFLWVWYDVFRVSILQEILVSLSIITSQITDNSYECSDGHQRKHENSVLLALFESTLLKTKGFPSQRIICMESVSIEWHLNVMMGYRCALPLGYHS